MPQEKLVLGTRGSALALSQAEIVRAMIQKAYPRFGVEIKIVKTSGDKQKTASLSKSGTVGFFTKELEEALLRRKVDAAVHSLKDLPTVIPAGLTLAAVTEREDPSDVLIFKDATDGQNPKRVFTSSPRRSIQAKILWPGCEALPIRGNVETRLEKIAQGEDGDALLLAAAGLRRLDYLKGDKDQGKLLFEDLNYIKLSLSQMIPAPGQAAIGIEIRSEDGIIQERLKSVNHHATHAAVTAERSFLRALGGGCAEPIAAYTKIETQGMRLFGLVARNEKIWRGELWGERKDAENMGKELAKKYEGEALRNLEGEAPSEPK